MISAPLPPDELERLRALVSYDVLDSPPEQAYDDLTRIATEICGTPIALISLVDEDRQWFKSRVGLDATETPRELAFCSHAILETHDIFLVPDSERDERFADNPLVTGEPHVRFYAGAPLVTSAGSAIGTLCVIDHEPRQLSGSQEAALLALARQVVALLELRKTNRELEHTFEKAEAANAELSSFTSLAAHDLREPLRTLVSFSAFLAEDLVEEFGDVPSGIQRDLDNVVDAAQRMDAMVVSLRELCEVGVGSVKGERVDVSECVEVALLNLERRVEETAASIEIDPLPEVIADRELLHRVFQNLIGNALKFRQGTPHVRITCDSGSGEPIFGVQDDGIGLETGDAAKIFEPFRRLHPRSKFEGAGLGLAIVRKAIECHGGEIWFEASPSGGSHFRFTLGPRKSTRVA